MQLSRSEARTKAVEWWEQSGRNEALCDICSGLLYPKEGYLVDGKTVFKSKCWRKYIVPVVLKCVKQDYGFKLSKEELKKARVIATEWAKMDPKPWLLCEGCFIKIQ